MGGPAAPPASGDAAEIVRLHPATLTELVGRLEEACERLDVIEGRVNDVHLFLATSRGGA